MVEIPLISSSFSAGTGNPLEDAIEPITLPLSAIKSVKSPYGIHVTGNSMLPTINDKDIAIIEANGRCNNGDIIALQFNGELLIKEFRETFNGLELVSHNSEFKTIKIDETDSFTIFGKVIRYIRNL